MNVLTTATGRAAAQPPSTPPRREGEAPAEPRIPTMLPMAQASKGLACALQLVLNKSMDRDDLHRPECQAVLIELFGLMRRMRAAGVDYSSWYGRLNAWPSPWENINRGADYEPWPDNPDELRIPWFLLWEIAWLTANTPMKRPARILDMGGAGSLFSCYLASLGHEVWTIDLEPRLCEQADRLGAQMGWRLYGRTMDMTRLTFDDGYFDHVFSVCVFEHLPVSGRIECNKGVARVLKPGGTASYTFDYANPQAFGRLDSPADVERQFVEPSGLVRRGGPFVDGGKRYLESPCCFGFGRFNRWASRLHAWATGLIDRRRNPFADATYTFGAVFLEKPLA